MEPPSHIESEAVVSCCSLEVSKLPYQTQRKFQTIQLLLRDCKCSVSTSEKVFPDLQTAIDDIYENIWTCKCDFPTYDMVVDRKVFSLPAEPLYKGLGIPKEMASDLGIRGKAVVRRCAKKLGDVILHDKKEYIVKESLVGGTWLIAIAKKLNWNETFVPHLIIKHHHEVGQCFHMLFYRYQTTKALRFQAMEPSQWVTKK
jgi:hypothetical protein